MGSNVRLLFALLALLGLGYLWLQLGRGDDVRVSRWRSVGGADAAGVTAPAPAGLSGVARAQQGRGLPGGNLQPQGNPLQASNAVMTQGYGVGSHAPAETWGGVDLAIDSDGDGYADPDGSWDHPVYATHDGVVKLTPNSYPAGNHIRIANEQYRSGYAHLASYAVEDGATVRRGDLVGYVGSTGQSSGPHLHYDTWVLQGGAWVNVNPLDYGALDGTGT